MKLTEAIIRLAHTAHKCGEKPTTVWFTDRQAFIKFAECVEIDIGTPLYAESLPKKDWFTFAGVRFAMLTGDLT